MRRRNKSRHRDCDESKLRVRGVIFTHLDEFSSIVCSVREVLIDRDRIADDMRLESSNRNLSRTHEDA